jgi:hypothetical protein
MRRKYNLWMLTVGLLTGCTSVLTTSVIERTDTASKDVKQGIVYYLPETILTVSLQHTLLYCSDTSDTPNLIYETTADVKVHSTIDTSTAFVIDPEDLHRWNKKWALNVELYPNGLLKSVMTSADDQSLDLAIAGVKTVINLASISQGIPPLVPIVGIDKSNPEVHCMFELTDSGFVQEVADQYNADIKISKSELKKAKQILDAKKGDNSAEEKIYLQATKAVSKATLNRDAFVAKTVIKQEIVLPLKNLPIDLVPPSANSFKKWLAIQPSNQAKVSLFTKQLATRYNLKLGLASNDGLTDSRITQKYKLDSNVNQGLYYSTFGTASILLEKKNNIKNDIGSGSSTLFRGFVKAPEFGDISILPFSNLIGESNNVEITFNSDGSLASVDYGTERSSSEKIVSTSDQVNSLIGEYEENKQTKENEVLLKKQLLKLHSLSIASQTSPNASMDELVERSIIIEQLLKNFGNTESSRETIITLAKDISNEELSRLRLGF